MKKIILILTLFLSMSTLGYSSKIYNEIAKAEAREDLIYLENNDREVIYKKNYENWDNTLNIVYKEVIETLKRIGDKELLDKFIEQQRAWVKYKELVTELDEKAYNSKYSTAPLEFYKYEKLTKLTEDKVREIVVLIDENFN